MSWTTLVDEATLDNLPDELSGISPIDFYKHIGCDIFLLNCWGMPYNFNSPVSCYPEAVQVQTREETEDNARAAGLKTGGNYAGKSVGKKLHHEWITPEGTLTKVMELNHPVKFPVTDYEDLKVYRWLWENVEMKAVDDSDVFRRVNDEIGEAGIVTRFCQQSAVSLLLEHEMGTECFYYMLQDHPAEMEALFDIIHQKKIKEWEIIAQGPFDIVILCEDTSTTYINPGVYRKYNKPHVKDFIDIMQGAGKIALVHMCGLIKDLLADMEDLGFDGIHGLTPPPLGNTPFELALDVFGDDLIMMGGLNVNEPVALQEVPKILDQAYTERLRRANFIFWLGADGITVPLERFQAVGEWMRKRGQNEYC